MWLSAGRRLCSAPRHTPCSSSTDLAAPSPACGLTQLVLEISAFPSWEMRLLRGGPQGLWEPWAKWSA